MNNQITENYVSFEVAKLLKQKGFNITSKEFWIELKEYTAEAWNNKQDDIHFKAELPRPMNLKYTREGKRPFIAHAPHVTQALAIKWIRENFKLNIEIYWKNEGKIFFGQVYPISSTREQVHFTVGASIHEEALNNALIYTLTNLIK